jgi:nucleotide-binding universal stress UspA family protein
LVSAENLAEAENVQELRAVQVAAAEQNCAVAARALPDAPDIECLVAEGMTLESALKKLNWDDGDLLVVGSSRFAAPRRIFLGSTAARILAAVDVPVIVIPKAEAGD